MNYLKKETWKDLSGSAIGYLVIWLVIVSSTGVPAIPDFNTPSDSRIFGLVVGLFAGLACVYGWFAKERAFSELSDERELHIYRNAKRVGDAVFKVLCVAGVCFLWLFYESSTPFPIILPVTAILTFWIIAGMVKNVIVLVQLRSRAE